MAAIRGTGTLPMSAIYGFNGTFPGPMINAEYGRPVVIRFENDLDLNPHASTARTSARPTGASSRICTTATPRPRATAIRTISRENEGAYHPAEWCDNLYLMYPAGGDDREKQSFLWFHDHRMHHTGANVYKGMVGLMPHYDPKIDSGDETDGACAFRACGTNNPDGTFDVDYDIPLALYDCALDDGEVRHRDQHIPDGQPV